MRINYVHLRNCLIPNDKAESTSNSSFSYYSQWIHKIKPLIMADSFLSNPQSVKAFKNLKEEIGSALFHIIEENIPQVVETDASDQAQPSSGHLLTNINPPERKYASVEKEAAAIVEATKRQPTT